MVSILLSTKTSSQQLIELRLASGVRKTVRLFNAQHVRVTSITVAPRIQGGGSNSMKENFHVHCIEIMTVYTHQSASNWDLIVLVGSQESRVLSHITYLGQGMICLQMLLIPHMIRFVKKSGTHRRVKKRMK
mmetsp:Transcript_14066/g.41229  ORF Transcript_14066/g.41229 Transcript_14066/m.41229 type:complete len:132 (-) Transcript_14066:481-876(-)